MVSFNYVIKDEIGIHARPAGMLAKEAKAVYKIDGIALVNCEIFEKFLESFREF